MGACLRVAPPSPPDGRSEGPAGASSSSAGPDGRAAAAHSAAKRRVPVPSALWGRLAEGVRFPGHGKGGVSTPRSSGAAFELQLRLDAGRQALSDKALRRATGSEGSSGTAQRSASSRSVLSKRSWSRQALAAQAPTCSASGRDGAAELRFGADAQNEPECIPWARCGICLVEPSGLSGGHASRYCANPECQGAFCGDCFGQYASGKVADALHFAPPINCPGCKMRVRTSIWAPLVPNEVRCQYQANASALLAVRCPACDKVCSLLVESSPDAGTDKGEEDLLAACGLEPDASLGEAWSDYASGDASAESMLSALLRVSLKDVADLPHAERARLTKLVEHAASLVQDAERRVTLQLAWLRHCPKIRTPCCYAKLCFKCKVQGWHPRLSCEQQQRRFIGSEAGVQPCPQCGVPTQRTDGCNQVQCVCGCVWEWDDTAHGVPLILACSMVPHTGGKDDFKALVDALLERGATLEDEDPDDGSRIGSCLVSSTTSVTHDRFEPSDAGRLSAALELVRERGSSEAIDLDFLDNDGDSPLSVAISSGNVEAVRLLVGSAVTLGPSHMENLRGACVSSATRRAMTQELAPLAHDRGRWRENVDALEVYLQMCMPEEACASLEAEYAEEQGQLAESHASAFVGGGLSAEAAPRLRELLESCAARDGADWGAMCATAAGVLLRVELCGAWPLGFADAGVLGHLIAARADISSDETGKSIIDEALEREDAVAVGALLAAGPASSSGNFWHDRALQLMWRDRSRPVVEVLSAHFRDSTDWLPLWLCVQLGLGERVSAHLARLSDEADVVAEPYLLLDDRLIIACIKREVFIGEEDWIITEVEAALRPHLEGTGRNLASAKKEAATALLLMEMKCCYNFERDPDVAALRSLLEGAGADPNATAGSLSSEVFQKCARICDSVAEESEYRFPLFTLAVNTYCSPEGAEAATELMVQHGADLDQVDEDGDTALTVSFMKENIAVAESLIRHGADISSAADAWDAYQAWEHPPHLRRLAAALQGRTEDVWTPKQRLLLGIAAADEVPEMIGHFEDCEEAARALLLARGHCGPRHPTLDALEAALRETWGEEEFDQARLRAATSSMRAEVSGALEGMWRLDCDFALQLLLAGADASSRVVLPLAVEDDFDDEDESEQDVGDESAVRGGLFQYVVDDDVEDFDDLIEDSEGLSSGDGVDESE